jgi:hypothetical protein
MKLSIEKLLGVRSATIDLSTPLTVIAGPDHSARSVIARALYGFLKLKRDVGRLTAIKDRLKQSEIRSADSIDLVRFLATCKRETQDELARRFRDSLPAVFALPDERFRDAVVRVEIDDVEEIRESLAALDVYHKVMYYNRDLTFSVNKPKGSTVFGYSYVIEREYRPEESNVKIRVSDEFLYNTVANILTGLFLAAALPHPFAQPTERAAIAVLGKTVAAKRASLMEEMLEVKGERAEIDPLNFALRGRAEQPASLKDNVAFVEDVGALLKEKSEFATFARQLEEQVLGGRVELNERGETAFLPNDARESIPLHVAPAAARAVAGLVLYFRYLARRNHRLTIEEPELHLSPDQRARMARFLARAVNAGVASTIETNDDVMLRELSNLVAFSKKDDARRQLARRVECSRGDVVEPTSIAVWSCVAGEARRVPVTENGFDLASLSFDSSRLAELARAVASKIAR